MLLINFQEIFWVLVDKNHDEKKDSTPSECCQAQNRCSSFLFQQSFVCYCSSICYQTKLSICHETFRSGWRIFHPTSFQFLFVGILSKSPYYNVFVTNFNEHSSLKILQEWPFRKLVWNYVIIIFLSYVCLTISREMTRINYSYLTPFMVLREYLSCKGS